MDKTQYYENLLSTYSLEELLIAVDLEPVDVLRILDELGYLTLDIPEPL